MQYVSRQEILLQTKKKLPPAASQTAAQIGAGAGSAFRSHRAAQKDLLSHWTSSSLSPPPARQQLDELSLDLPFVLSSANLYFARNCPASCEAVQSGWNMIVEATLAHRFASHAAVTVSPACRAAPRAPALCSAAAPAHVLEYARVASVNGMSRAPRQLPAQPVLAARRACSRAHFARPAIKTLHR